MSASSLATVTKTSRANVLNVIKEIFMKVIDLAKDGEEIKLDIKIGYLIIDEN